MKNRKIFTPQVKAEMVLKVLKEEEPLCHIASEYGVHPNVLSKWKTQFLKDAAIVFQNEHKPINELKSIHEKQLNELYAEIGRLTSQLSWLKKNVEENLSRTERLDLLELNRDEFPLSTQASLLGLNRSGIYYKPVLRSPEEVMIKRLIDEIYTARPFYGSRRISVTLKNKGYMVNRKAVQRHMREMGIEGIHPGPNLSKRELEHRIFPYLLRDLIIERPDHVWGIDITYIRLQSSWMYLVAIIDWYSRYIVEWELDQTLEMPFILEAVNRAFAGSVPEIFNSDQGSHFTSPQYINLLKEKNVLISMDGKGRAIDNIFTERFWRSLKYEEVYLKDYSSPREARRGIKGYIDFYNRARPHQSLGYETPANVYHGN